MTAGDNLSISGVDIFRDFRTFKTGSHDFVKLVIDDYSYSYSLNGKQDIANSFMGSIPQRDLTMYVTSDIPNIINNSKMKLDLCIENKSKYKLTIYLSDKQGNRVNIMDRNKNIVTSDSNSEKLNIIY